VLFFPAPARLDCRHTRYGDDHREGSLPAHNPIVQQQDLHFPLQASTVAWRFETGVDIGVANIRMKEMRMGMLDGKVAFSFDTPDYQ
jgi:hypothetical protein